jgi:hypothetical protein
LQNTINEMHMNIKQTSGYTNTCEQLKVNKNSSKQQMINL